MSQNITLQFASGNTFFIGLSVIIAAAMAKLTLGKARLLLCYRLAALLGAVLVAASATPLNLWCYIAWGTLLALVFQSAIALNHWQMKLMPLALILLSLVMCIHECTFRHTPKITMSTDQTIFVIGDSISAGIGQETATWPKLMAEKHQLTVVNLARPGATVSGAMDQSKLINQSNALILVEIGGNDFMGTTSSLQFTAHLEQLLSSLTNGNHSIALFELPLPPFHNAFGQTQRSLARKYHASLIPKSCLADVMKKENGTIDGIHLSQSGHAALADQVFNMLTIR